MIDDWKPAEEDMDWTERHFDSMAVGDTWSVSGALLEKTEEKQLTLRQYPAESSLAVQRVQLVCEAINIDFNSEGSQLIVDPMKAAQQAAQEWQDPESGIPLVNFDLANPHWSVSAVPSQDAEGNAVLTDQWTVRITHPNEEGDAHEVLMTPMDYHLIAGDDLFFTWNDMRVLERQEAIEIGNSREYMLQMIDGNIMLLGDTLVNDEEETLEVPPHLRGMLMTRITTDEEE